MKKRVEGIECGASLTIVGDDLRQRPAENDVAEREEEEDLARALCHHERGRGLRA